MIRKKLECLEWTVGRNMERKLQVLLVKAQKEMRNKFLESRRKRSFVIQWQKLRTGVCYSYAKGRTYKWWIWILTEISQVLKIWLDFPLMFTVKEIKWGKKHYTKRTRTWWFGKCSAYPDYKILKLGDSQSRKRALERKLRAWLYNLFVHASGRAKGQSMQAHGGLFKEIRHVTHGSSPLVQQKPAVERGSSKQDLWRDLSSKSVNAQDIYGRSTGFLRLKMEIASLHWKRQREKTEWKKVIRLLKSYRMKTGL